MERNVMTAQNINKELRKLQQDWYDNLPDKYKPHDIFSSPF
jgi:hypothetical protein